MSDMDALLDLLGVRFQKAGELTATLDAAKLVVLHASHWLGKTLNCPAFDAALAADAEAIRADPARFARYIAKETLQPLVLRLFQRAFTVTLEAGTVEGEEKQALVVEAIETIDAFARGEAPIALVRAKMVQGMVACMDPSPAQAEQVRQSIEAALGHADRDVDNALATLGFGKPDKPTSH